MRISFLDCTGLSYTAIDSERASLGGIERCVNALSTALVKLGHSVVVHNGVTETIVDSGVTYSPLLNATAQNADVLIVCNNADLFDRYKMLTGQKNFCPVLWLHNPISLLKTIRKGRYAALLRWKPMAVFLGEYHRRTASCFLPFSKRVIIPHGVETMVLSYPLDKRHEVRSRVATYLSQAYRGLDGVLKVWREQIHPALPDAILDVYAEATASEEDRQAGVRIHGRVPRAQLTAALSRSRLTFVPGHEDETFCLSAAESLCLGAPVLTYGIASLSERVSHNRTGYIANNETDFASAAKKILTDDTYWTALHDGALQERESLSWGKVSKEWDAMLNREQSERML